jgi:hypothetical protein
MKKIILSTAIILCSCMLFKSADAQIRLSLGFNINSQPDWGPVGYDHADYYYMPDIDTYYDVTNHQYVYYQNNSWIHAGSLPARYRNYDLYHGYKVVVNQRSPWLQHSTIRAKYANYRGRSNQQVIRDSRDTRYRNHWQGDNRGRGPGNSDYGHSRGNVNNNDRGNKNDRGNDHDNGNGHGNGKDKH